MLIRTDCAGGTHAFLDWSYARGVQYSIGFTPPADMPDLDRLIPQDAWTPAINAGEEIRRGADVADVIGMLDLAKCRPKKRVIVRRERPHPGAQGTQRQDVLSALNHPASS